MPRVCAGITRAGPGGKQHREAPPEADTELCWGWGAWRVRPPARPLQLCCHPETSARDQHLGFFLEDEPSFHSFHGKRQMGSVAQPCK